MVRVMYFLCLSVNLTVCLVNCLVRRVFGSGWDKRIGFGLYQSCWNRGSVARLFGLRWCQRVSGWGLLSYVCVCLSLDSLCIWQVRVSLYCARRMPAYLRCTQCSILLHLIDICFLLYICLWQISQSTLDWVWLSDLD